MKILHLLSQIPDATGSGIYLQAAMRHAAQRGFTNILLAGVPIHADHLELLDLSQDCYHPVHFGRDIPFPVVGMSDVMPYPSTRFCDLSSRQLDLYLDRFEEKLDEAIERHQPDLIHSHHLWLLTSLTKQKYPHIPMITSCHGSDLRQFHNCRHLHPLVLPGCRKVDTICALSTVQKLEISQLYQVNEERIEVIGAGYDKQLFYWSQSKRPNRPIEILYAGKLSRAKGLPWLIKALQLLPHQEFCFHLVGAGHGSEGEEILAQATALEPKIKIHGKLEQHQLASLMRQADLFVLPSFFEGLPLVLLEALASGCHILATALPGISELFHGTDRRWIELVELPQMISIDRPHPADEGHFINALVSALSAQCHQLATTDTDQACPPSLKILLEQFTWEGIFKKLESLYLRYSAH